MNEDDDTVLEPTQVEPPAPAVTAPANRLGYWERRFPPRGTRVRLLKMDNEPNPLPAGALGTVRSVDDAGTVHVTWDGGRNLGLVTRPLGDEYALVEPSAVPPGQRVLVVLDRTPNGSPKRHRPGVTEAFFAAAVGVRLDDGGFRWCSFSEVLPDPADRS